MTSDKGYRKSFAALLPLEGAGAFATDLGVLGYIFRCTGEDSWLPTLNFLLCDFSLLCLRTISAAQIFELVIRLSKMHTPPYCRYEESDFRAPLRTPIPGFWTCRRTL